RRVEREFYQQIYSNSLVRLVEEEKDYVPAFLLCRKIADHLPHAKRLWVFWSECCDKLGMISAARRCSVIGLHVHPTQISAIENLRQFIEIYGPHNGQGELLRQRQFELNPLDFELRMYYFIALLSKYSKSGAKNKAEAAYSFIFDYLYSKHVAPIKIDTSKQNINALITSQQLSEFRAVADEFFKSNLSQMGCDVLELGLKLSPFESSFYYTLYEQYASRGLYTNAFKSYSHYLYCSGGAGSSQLSPYSAEQYATCGELLEKSGYFVHAFHAYHQSHLIEQQEVQFQTQTENLILTKWLKHIQLNILPNISEKDRNDKLFLSTPSRNLLDKLLSLDEITLPDREKTQTEEEQDIL
ncbi:hypothetical protein AKO1_003940, partial [Acrasis kona]